MLGQRANGIIDTLQQIASGGQTGIQPHQSPTLAGQAPYNTGLSLETKAALDEKARMAGIQNPAFYSTRNVTPYQPQQVPQSTPTPEVGSALAKPTMPPEVQEKAQVAEAVARKAAANPEAAADPTFAEKVKGYFGNEENMLKLAMAFNTMRMEPDPSIAAYAADRLKTLQSTKATQGTVQKLEAMGTPAARKAAEYIKSTGDVKGGLKIFSDYGSVVQGTGAELASKYGVQGLDPEKPYNLDVNTGKVTGIGSGGTEVTVAPTIGGGDAFVEGANKALVSRFDEYAQTGQAAGRNVTRLQRLEFLLQETPQGFMGAATKIAGDMGIELEGADNLQAALGIINSLVPEQRPAGSGPMSDADLNLFKESLPRLINTPEGNRKILETLRQMVDYDVQRGIIADQALMQEISPQEARDRINALNDPLAWLKAGEVGTGDGAGNALKYKRDANGLLVRM